MRITEDQANELIKESANKAKLLFADGNTNDIIKVVLHQFANYYDEVKDFAPLLIGNSVEETCSNIWHFVKKYIAYKKDPAGVQWIKSPARLWKDREGDCKSYAVFIASVLTCLGIECFFRFVSFDSDKTPTHVYVVVKKGSREIYLDCVIGQFNREPRHTWQTDYATTLDKSIHGVGVVINQMGIGETYLDNYSNAAAVLGDFVSSTIKGIL